MLRRDPPGPTSPNAARDHDEPFPERLGDFHLLERLGGGGMGVVYLARQESLGRLVALKLIHPEQLYFPGARERFLREVEAIARLQHPGIVPVHTFGEHDGLPFFAMERVEGCTLAEVLRAVEGKSPERLKGDDFAQAVARRTSGATAPTPTPTPGGAPLFAGSWLETSLRIAREVALALAHAHERGVLHRDVKPSNVMVTPGGRVLLLDFGLATTEGMTKLTRTGALVGSLPYLAPEHFGSNAPPAPTSDVYALGATLYELLALHVPFAAESFEELRDAVLAGHPPLLRAAHPSLPWDVETVCGTALERDPARRYPSALAFALDLDNLLRLRPIAARRPGVALRARRWMQRHPTGTVALALGGLLLVGGPTALFWQQQRNLAALRSEQAKTVREKERALAHFRRVLDTIQKTLERVEDPRLDDVAELEPLRRAIYGDALAVYESFRGDEANDPALREGRGRDRRRLGELLSALGRSAEAEAADREAIEELARLHDEHPDDDDAAYELAVARHRLAFLEVEAGRPDDAAQHARAAVVDLDRLSTRHPDDAGIAHQAIDARVILAWAQQRGGEAEQAFATITEVPRRIEANLARAPDDDDETRLEAADVLAKAGGLLVSLGHLAEGDAPLARAVELLTRRAPPAALALSVETTRAELASARADLAARLERDADAAAFREEAARLFRDLFERHPERMAFRSALATALSNLGQHELDGDGDLEKARKLLEEAVQLLEAAARAEPEVAEHDAKLAATLTNLAVAELDSGRAALAETHLLSAAERGRKYRARNGDDPRAALYLDSALSYLAEAQLAVGKRGDAAATARELKELLPDDESAQQRADHLLEKCGQDGG